MALTKVSTDGVKDDAITKSKIPANQIEASELADDAVTQAKIAPNAVDTTELAVGAVTHDQLADNTVDAGHLQTNAVTTDKIVNSAINQSKLADASINAAKIQDQAVTLAKLEHGTSSNDGKFLRANNGADPTFETVTGTTINNNADSRIITGSDTANTLEGEDRLLWNGTSLTLEKNQNAYLNPELNLYNSFNGGWGAGITFSGKYSGSKETQARIRVYGGQNANDASMAFETGNPNEIIRLLPGGGITFNGDTSAANALDDYEEGSWTPSMSNTGSLSNGVAAGRYTKIGRMVHFVAKLQWSNRSANGNYNITFSSLPFTAAGYFQFPIYVGGNEGFADNYSDRHHIGGSILPNTSGGQFRISSSDGQSEISFHGGYGATNAGYIYWGGTYYIN